MRQDGVDGGKADVDDELERDGDPLSLEDLEGWMNSINNSAAAAQAVMPAAATIPLDDTPSPGQQAEVEYLKKELGDLGVAHPELDGSGRGEDKSPNPFSFYPEREEEKSASLEEIEDDDDEDDCLGLDFIAQV